MCRLYVASLGLVLVGLSACAGTPVAPKPVASASVEQACGTYRAMMTAPMPPSETEKLRLACEAAMKAEKLGHY